MKRNKVQVIEDGDSIVMRKLNEIEKIIRKSKKYWRFNYSVGYSDGSCFGSDYEDKNKLKGGYKKWFT